MIEPEDYDPEVDGEEGYLVDADPIDDLDDELWSDDETSEEFLK